MKYHLNKFQKESYQYWKVYFFLFILFPFLSFGQEIDPTFIAEHTYIDLKDALKNPEDVYGLDLSATGLRELPTKIVRFKELRKLELNFNILTNLPPEIG